MAPSWIQDPIPRLEDLAEARVGTPGPGLPSHAPVVDRPTLQLLLGSVPEGELGAFGSAERRTAESGLIAGFLQQYGPHLARGGPLRPGQEGSRDMGWLISFGEAASQSTSGVLSTSERWTTHTSCHHTQAVGRGGSSTRCIKNLGAKRALFQAEVGHARSAVGHSGRLRSTHASCEWESCLSRAPPACRKDRHAFQAAGPP